MSLLSFHRVTLMLANQAILDNVDWQIQANERIALVGRNGAGKSTLLHLLQGNLVQDSGHIHQRNGLIIAGLTQEVPIHEDASVYQFLVKQLGEVGTVLNEFYQLSSEDNLNRLALCQQRMDNLNAWNLLTRIETMSTRLQIDPRASMQQLSGGMKRRVLLASALIAEPDLLLLDEPTNHLDIQAIEWLESYLRTYPGSVLLVTHDRAFLSQVANRIVEIDRGKLHRYDCDYETYLDRREAVRLSEQTHNALFDKRLSDEEAWLRTGIKARRTRNEGRVRALKAMREAHQQRRSQLGQVKSIQIDVARSGHIVLEATDLTYHLQNKPLIQGFSFLLTRGDKVGIIGPNGCGKTTLVRLLLGELMPHAGSVRQGTALSIAYFDQLRRQLDEHQTVMANVADGADYVTVQGQQQHVASYLRDFLFTPERFHQPVSALSGGERNRLLLAKLFARPANVLVLDEPTNDLDMETLELLENVLINYSGTVLLISHDRAFINQVVTSVLVYEDTGVFREHLGGYDAYFQEKTPPSVALPTRTASSPPTATTTVKLNAQEQRELKNLPNAIETLEKTIAVIHSDMAKPAFYQNAPEDQMRVQKQLSEYELKLAGLYDRWDLLETKGTGS